MKNRWEHRTAWVLASAIFLGICLGGLTSTYPSARWFSVWAVFLQYGHRLTAAAVGLISVVLAVLVWRCGRPRLLRWAAVAAVVGLGVQGTLGGLRVVGDDPLLAKIHGCTAPLVFAAAATLVALTSPAWRASRRPNGHPAGRALWRLALGCTAGTYLQIVLCGQLRHVPPDTAPGRFELWVWLVLIVAGGIVMLTAWLVVFVRRRFRDEPMIVRRTGLLAVVCLLEIVLGVGTWVTHYNWPAWFTDYIWAVQYTVVAEGPVQALTTTAHVGAGSLTLAAALSLAVWTRRVLVGPVERGTPRGA